jgi:hypothetical protein
MAPAIEVEREKTRARIYRIAEEAVMGIQMLTTFFMWCTIINGGILVLWTLLFMSVPDLVYRTQRKWFPIPRETFTVVIYSFLGLFKVAFLVFNVVPYVALLIVA